MTNKKLVIYHRNCQDGFCAAWIWNQVFPEDEFLPMNYGDPVPDMTGRKVYMLDFSLRRKNLLEAAKAAKSITILDHHESAEKELAGIEQEADNITCMFDMDRSGATLTWDYLRCYGFELEGYHLVQYVEDRDLWRWKLADSKAINAAIGSYPLDFKTWDELAEELDSSNDGIYRIKDQGEAILRYQSQQIKRILENKYRCKLAGYEVDIVNSPVLQSKIGHELAILPENPFGVTWRLNGEGTYLYSFRSVEGKVNVGELAKKAGGGGHAFSSSTGSKVRLDEPI